MVNVSAFNRIRDLVIVAPLFILSILSMLILTYSPPATSAEIGAVKKITGDAYGTPPQDSRARKFARDNVFQDELIETSGGAATLIEFTDETELFVGSRSSLMLDEMVYDAGANDSMVVELVVGSFRFVSGKIDDSKVIIKTPSAQIGIRGSEAIIFVTKDGATTINVLQGSFTVESRSDDSQGPIEVTPNQNVTVSKTATTTVQAGMHIPELGKTDFTKDLHGILAPGSSFDQAGPGKVDSYGSGGDSSSSSSSSSGSSY